MVEVKKKILSLLLVLMLVVSPRLVNAESIDLSNYTSQTLEEVFKAEEVEYDFSNYEETDDQVTVYLFRGSGCGYCAKFLNFLATTLLDEYGKYFKVVSYEVWYDSNNSDLFEQTADFLGDSADGVPYIVIGDKTFAGYADSYDEDIEAAIMDLYNSEDRYDVFEEMAKNTTSTSEAKSSNTVAIVIWNIIIVAIATIIIINVNNSNKEEILEKIDEIKKASSEAKKTSKK
jgi:glutaredoxin